ncbi:hypothetical protein LUZ63_017507 [Rhynchospora breviuscula]|uniref:ATP-dependent DNA helicase n=1 Tax=Rhynchospora breviuscula TaxID=2022672 RepID=A0A9Q0C2K5_9POAL|nr:hypothetical protein LUZ63_017507 [Rhynchospora breviuscula]
MSSANTQWSQTSTSDELPLSVKYYPKIKPSRPYCSRRVQGESSLQDNEPYLMDIAGGHGLQQLGASKPAYKMLSSTKMLATSTQWSQSSTSDDLTLSAKFFPRIKPKKPYCSRRAQNESFPQDDEPCLTNIAVDHGLQQSEASEPTYEMLSSSVQWSQSSISDELPLSVKFFPKIKDNRLYSLGRVNNESLFKKSTAPCLTNIDAGNNFQEQSKVSKPVETKEAAFQQHVQSTNVECSETFSSDDLSLPLKFLRKSCKRSRRRIQLACGQTSKNGVKHRFRPLDIGRPDRICSFCGAFFWHRERCVKTSTKNCPTYNLCCRKGRVSIPLLEQPPYILQQLLSSGDNPDSKHFKKLIRVYNSMFSFTSFGCKLDDSINNGSAPYVFKISGQISHKMGSFLPLPGYKPTFAQLYVYDTENEIQNRLAPFSHSSLHDQPRPHIVQSLCEMFAEHNALVKEYRTIKERLDVANAPQLQIRIHSDYNRTNPQYCPPSASEVVGFVVGDISSSQSSRDIIVEYRSKKLQRIYNDNPLCMPFQYPIIFARGEKGYHPYIRYKSNTPGTKKLKRQYVTMAEYYSFRLHPRRDEPPTIFQSGRLFQQIVVDIYVSIEQKRLYFIEHNQHKLRTDKLCNIRRAVTEGDMLGCELGKRIMLPSSHVGSPRYMFQNYHDCIALCRHFGPPDLFVTFTCNPQWVEIEQSILPGQHSNERPDIVCRVFKMKHDELMRDIKRRSYFGRAIAVVSQIEFQKRGLPHAHIIIWLATHDKLKTAADVDRLIAAELPDPNTDPVGYEAVSKFMLHGPCGIVNSWPSIERLPVHLPDENNITFTDADCLTAIINNGDLGKTKLTEWFVLNRRDPAAQTEDGHFFFVNGHGGTGKTFLWQSIIASVRSQGKIVLPVASSGLAALLLEGGTTAHSRFKIPVDVADMKTCDIKQGTHLAELIQHTSLIIWDEAPMNHKSCFEALDITLRDIMGLISNERKHKIFGGITVVLGGDFRQTLPIIAGGSRYDSVSSCITNSYLWSHCRMFELKINMRLLHAHMNSEEREEAEQFASWLLAVGNGTVKGKKIYGSSEADWIKMPSEILLPVTAEPCTSIISATYTDIKSNYQNIQYLHDRAIVTPTNQDADTINSIITDMIPGKPFVYLSSDSIQEKETMAEKLRDMYLADYLRLLSPNGVPNHEISLKNGIPIMLLRNIDPSAGLCNGTRLLGAAIEAEILKSDYYLLAIKPSDGDVYIFRSFRVDEAKPDYNATGQRLIIKLHRYTQVIKVKEQHNEIPLYYFKFRELEEIGVNLRASKTVVDIIGRISAIGQTRQANPDSNVHYKDIVITNERNTSVRVTLWPGYAELIDTETIQEISKTNPVVIAFSSLEIKYYKGVYSLKTFSATKVYMDPAQPEILAYTDRFQGVQHPIGEIESGESQASRSSSSTPPIPKTLLELIELEPLSNKDQLYICEATISDILNKESWTYTACPSCKSMLPWRGKSCTCERCGIEVNTPIQWYSLYKQSLHNIIVLQIDIALSICTFNLFYLMRHSVTILQVPFITNRL